MIFLRTSLVLILFCCAAIGSTREEEVIDIISQAIQRKKEIGSVVTELSKEDKDMLLTYSNDEILGGFILKLDRYEQDDRTKMSWRAGSDEHRIMKFNDDLVPDETLLRAELAKEKNPRRFHQLAVLSGAITKARKADFIPEQFNSLFREGAVIRFRGQSTPRYAGSVSRFTYESITGSLKYTFEVDYEPPGPTGGRKATHEQKVDHLAKWLIANWPGCENFTLSDQNVPAILASSSAKKISRNPRTQSEETPSPAKEAFKFSWPIIAAIILLIGSFACWGKKKFAH